LKRERNRKVTKFRKERGSRKSSKRGFPKTRVAKV
jgi:hypothetical protein